MKGEITLSDLLNVLKKRWLVLILITLAAALATGLFVQFLVPKKYCASVQFHIINRNPNANYTQSALEGVKEYLANDYIAVINGDDMLEEVSDYLSENGYDLSSGAIRSMLEATADATSSQFSITVTTHDAKLSNLIISNSEKEAPDMIATITKANTTPQTEGIECVVPLRLRQADTARPDGPNVMRTALIAALIALVVSYLLFFLHSLMNYTIRSEEDAKRMLSVPILGVVPRWDSKFDMKNKQEGRS